MPVRLKIEINTREVHAFDTATALPLIVANPWFSGEATIPTFSREEMLATKLRALLQRDKGRDLYDLAHALGVFEGLDTDRIVKTFGQYLAAAGQAVSRAQAHERMFAKLANPRFLLDVRPLLPAAHAETFTGEAKDEPFRRVFVALVDSLPGEPWVRTPAMKQRFALSW